MQKLGELDWQRSQTCGEHSNCYEVELEGGYGLEVHRADRVWFWDMWGAWDIDSEGFGFRPSIKGAGGEAETRHEAIADAEAYWNQFRPEEL
jgi:hypothetical protein